MCSLNRVQLFHCFHECSYAHFIIIYQRCLPSILSHEVFRSIKNGIEFPCFIAKPDAFKKVTNLLSNSRKLKVVLGNAELIEG